MCRRGVDYRCRLKVDGEPTEGIAMSSQGFGAAAGIITGIISFFVIEQIVFHGDPSAGFPLGFFVVGAAMILIPVNIGAATLIGYRVYKALWHRDQV
jgi:hypothetical protein